MSPRLTPLGTRSSLAWRAAVRAVRPCEAHSASRRGCRGREGACGGWGRGAQSQAPKASRSTQAGAPFASSPASPFPFLAWPCAGWRTRRPSRGRRAPPPTPLTQKCPRRRARRAGSPARRTPRARPQSQHCGDHRSTTGRLVVRWGGCRRGGAAQRRARNTATRQLQNRKCRCTLGAAAPCSRRRLPRGSRTGATLCERTERLPAALDPRLPGEQARDSQQESARRPESPTRCRVNGCPDTCAGLAVLRELLPPCRVEDAVDSRGLLLHGERKDVRKLEGLGRALGEHRVQVGKPQLAAPPGPHGRRPRYGLGLGRLSGLRPRASCVAHQRGKSAQATRPCMATAASLSSEWRFLARALPGHSSCGGRPRRSGPARRPPAARPPRKLTVARERALAPLGSAPGPGQLQPGRERDGRGGSAAIGAGERDRPRRRRAALPPSHGRNALPGRSRWRARATAARRLTTRRRWSRFA